jgi:hypothetical protein
MQLPHPEAVSFVEQILAGDFNAAGIFADWLDEHNDPRGKLLRRRWKRWQKQKEVEYSPAAIAERKEADRRWERSRAARVRSLGEAFSRRLDRERDSDPGRATYTFINYIRGKFQNEYLSIPLDTNSQAYLSS